MHPASPWSPVLLAASLAAWPVSPAWAQDGGAPEDGLVARIKVSGGGQTCNAPCTAFSVAPDQALHLDGSSSQDGTADVASYLWELAERPNGSTADFTSRQGATTDLLPLGVGEYRVVLTVQGAGGTLRRAEVPVHVVAIPFRLRLTVQANDDEVSCEPRCDNNRIKIGTLVTADATASQHDGTHGDLVFTWTLLVPDGSGATLNPENNDNTKYSFRPDVDGSYEVRVDLKDNLDTATAWASFLIPTPFNYEPLDLSNCAAASPAALAPWALLAWVRVVRRRRASR